MTRATAIVYQKQEGPRLCGAAALCMAYRSLGVSASQEEVWPAIVGKNLLGDPCAFTHRLAGDALRRGLDAVVVQARDPWAALERCQEQAARAILNHRPAPQSMTGHFTVLVQLGEHGVMIHDPQFGPSRRLTREELLALWRRDHSPSYEVTGNGLVIVAARQPAPDSCPACGEALPEPLTCPKCRQSVPLAPAGVIGCLRETCPANVWQRIFCPSCDEPVWSGPADPRGDAAGSAFAPAGAGRGSLAVSDLLAGMAQVVASARETMEGPARETLDRLGAQIEEARVHAVPMLREQYEHSQDTLKRLQSQLTELKAKQEAEKQPRPAAPLMAPKGRPRKKVDPDLGHRLRKQLLEELQEK